MKHYTPRTKKAIKPVVLTRIVRIDHRTEIEIPAAMSNADAIDRYYAKHTTAKRPVIAVSDDEIAQEELAEVLDDDNLPEEE